MNADHAVLEAAVSGDDVAKARLLLEMGVDVNQRDEYGETVLFDAACNGSAAMVKLLIEYGADVNVRNIDGSTPLFDASIGDNLAAMKLLVDAGAHVNVLCERESPLEHSYIHYEYICRDEESASCMEFLLQSGAHWGLMLDCEDMPELSALDYRFLHAVVERDVKDVYTALESGANVNARGRYGVSALEQAVRYADKDLVMALFCFDPDDASVSAAFRVTECYKLDFMEKLLRSLS